MKKNYVKPSLLSETFVSENIMTGAVEEKKVFSTAIALYLDGQMIDTVNFTEGNTLNTIKVSDFNL